MKRIGFAFVIAMILGIMVIGLSWSASALARGRPDVLAAQLSDSIAGWTEEQSVDALHRTTLEPLPDKFLFAIGAQASVEQFNKPSGVAVVVQAEHMCMIMRGVKKPGSSIITSAIRGAFRTKAESRAEFFSLLQGK